MEKKLTARALKALEILKAGGYFREQLEGHWHGSEKFVVRLRTAAGAKVAGIGWKTRQELEQAGLLQYRACAKSSVWPTEHILKQEIV